MSTLPRKQNLWRHGRTRFEQPIRPVLAGFDEPVADWLFQSAMEARPGENAFVVQAGPDWPHGEGWLCVFGLRWLGSARRLAAPDSLVPVFCGTDGEARQVAAGDLAALIESGEGVVTAGGAPVPLPEIAEARTLAQQVLRERVVNREPTSRASVGLSLLLAAVVRTAAPTDRFPSRRASPSLAGPEREVGGTECNG